jgi:hypothetical protein
MNLRKKVGYFSKIADIFSTALAKTAIRVYRTYLGYIILEIPLVKFFLIKISKTWSCYLVDLLDQLWHRQK